MCVKSRGMNVIKYRDITGLQFGRLTAIKRVEDIIGKNGSKGEAWLCECSCGNEKVVRKNNLINGNTKSCGCITNKGIHEDLTGRVFGRLTVIEQAEDYITPGDGRHRHRWRCRCTCGNEVIITGQVLKSGGSKSCGCYQKELVGNMARIHGGYGERLNHVWNSMVQRCCNKNHISYHNYGERGITVCDEWRNDYAVFKEWALSAGYKEGLTLDRINNDLGYYPDNCRWVTMKEQSRNTRHNIYYTHDGETMCLSAWCEKLNLNYKKVHYRIRKRGLDFEEVILDPEVAI